MKNKNTTPRLSVPKSIIRTGHVLELISLKLATDFAYKLFITPVKHKTPKREESMENQSKKDFIRIDKFNVSIRVLTYGEGDKKALLVHGWSGRGTQMVSIADALIKEGYQIISFDAPAHGHSEGKESYMTMFIESIIQIGKIHGEFDLVVAHSLGGMSTINAARLGFKSKKIVTIGAGDLIIDVIKSFVVSLQLKPIILKKLYTKFEKKFKDELSNYDVYKSAKEVFVPVFVIHDKQDEDVSVKCAQNIYDHLPNGKLLITEGLGHRKILGDKKVIKQILDFAKT